MAETASVAGTLFRRRSPEVREHVTSIGAVGGIAFAVLAAAALAGQSLAVRLGTKAHPVTDVVAVMFVVNLLALVPATVVRHYPDFGVTAISLGSFALGGGDSTRDARPRPKR